GPQPLRRLRRARTVEPRGWRPPTPPRFHTSGTVSAHTRDEFPATLPFMATKAATAWGAAAIVDELTVPQRGGGKSFSFDVPVLQTAQGESLVRFAYSTDGVARRGPVTLRKRDVERLRASLPDHPRLAAVLGFLESGVA